ncbi:uncharacterized protein [Venturia canescens]|uniref:uncharacterized protein n=1 Tax=Venturia canescens TaxID=32260 RepID=UPI001C9D41ED|nr:uncharacterized protein LOC122410019 [Venturia canescens]
MAESDTDSEYDRDAPGPSTEGKLYTEFMEIKCESPYSLQDFEASATQSSDNQSQRSSWLQSIDDIKIEHDICQMEFESENHTENHTENHIQKPRQITGVGLIKAKTSAERGREFRARRALLNQQRRQQESATIDEISTENIQNAGPSKGNRIPGHSEINIVEKRAKSAESSRRWRARNMRTRTKAKQKAKTAAQRMREYRERKRLAKKALLRQRSERNLDAMDSAPTGENQSAGRSVLKSNSAQLRRGNEEIRLPQFVHHQETDENKSDFHDWTSSLNYDNITKHKRAHEKFDQKFRENPFGYSCTVCDRLWFKNDLKKAPHSCEDLLKKITNINNINDAMICSTCKFAIDRQIIPILSTYNGFKYPKIPSHLPKLNLVSQRLISPRLPFMQIRRLRHVHGQRGIYGETINVPISVDTMVNQLPRDINDGHCVYVHIKRKRIHKSSYLHGLINKKKIKIWLQYLINTPVYTHYNITINNEFLRDCDEETQDGQQINNIDEISEDIPIEESLTAQQHTLLWNDEKFLRIAPGEYNIPRSLLFNEDAEELSFPTIYSGQFRTYKNNIRATPFMISSSELRRSDRRGVTPYHLLYVAMKIMRLRIRDCLTVVFKHIGPNTNIKREHIESEIYMNNCIETNLAFLRSIPNSTWYWAQRKKDLFAIMRQKGRPTAFMTLSANEIGWTDLIQLLYKLANNGVNISDRVAAELSLIEKSTLINEDAVTCAIYFNKLVNVLLTILQSKECSPFRRYRVADYFEHIEFQHGGSPHAHILLWLDNAPKNMLGENNTEVINLIDSLVSVSTSQASGNIRLQTHKHTFTCYKKIVANRPQKCRFEAPFMPCRNTLNLTPIQKTDPQFQKYAKKYAEIRTNLENTDYNNIDEFYAKNNIHSDDEYCNILRAGINRPKIFYKRSPLEKWNIPFNPFVLSILRSKMDFQIITEEYSCAAYVVEYVNKTNRGISNLQRKMIEIMNEHPEFDMVDITRKMSVDIFNSVEISSQEAAWYLLREPMSKSSAGVVYINTVWPIERQKIRKTQKELSELDENSTDIWKEDWFDKYQKRPDELSGITLAQFVSRYFQKKGNVYAERKERKVIRFRNYGITQNYNEYRREMVTLHIPFRNEDAEILAEMKFIKIYDENEALILERRKEFESNLDIEKTIEICRQLCQEDGNPDDNDESEIQDVVDRFPEPRVKEERRSLSNSPSRNVAPEGTTGADSGRNAETGTVKRSRPDDDTPSPPREHQDKEPRLNDYGSYAQIKEGIIKLAIVMEGFPANQLGPKEVEKIRKIIRERILEVPQGTKVPTFTDFCERNGALIVSCADEQTKDWLNSFFLETPMDGKLLRVLLPEEFQKRYQVVVHVKEADISTEEAIKLLDRQNVGLGTDDWAVVKDSESRDASSTHFACFIGGKSLEALRKCDFRPFCGLSRASIRLVDKDKDRAEKSNSINLPKPAATPAEGGTTRMSLGTITISQQN